MLLPRTQARCSGFVLESDWSDFGQRLLHHRSKFTRSIVRYSLIARSRVFFYQTLETPRNEAGSMVKSHVTNVTT